MTVEELLRQQGVGYKYYVPVNYTRMRVMAWRAEDDVNHGTMNLRIVVKNKELEMDFRTDTGSLRSFGIDRIKTDKAAEDRYREYMFNMVLPFTCAPSKITEVYLGSLLYCYRQHGMQSVTAGVSGRSNFAFKKRSDLLGDTAVHYSSLITVWMRPKSGLQMMLHDKYLIPRNLDQDRGTWRNSMVNARREWGPNKWYGNQWRDRKKDGYSYRWIPSALDLLRMPKNEFKAWQDGDKESAIYYAITWLERNEDLMPEAILTEKMMGMKEALKEGVP